MRKWKGGITKHPNGFIAYVPHPNDATKAARKYHATREAAESWQNEIGRELWGDRWLTVKEFGVPHDVVLSRTPKKSVSIMPGVTDVTTTRLTNAGTLCVGKMIRATYLELNNGVKRHRAKAYFYDSKESGRTRDEAIELAIKIRKEKVESYRKAREQHDHIWLRRVIN